MKIKSGLILREVADNFIVVAVGDMVKEFNGIINLNSTGAFLWKILENGAEEEDLVKALLNEYEIDEATARRDVGLFIAKVKEAKLVK
ncbi:MAG: PqqD family protein [Clostridiales bacterium]|nr:PqqD family protein [Clostridiales bacterium]